MEAASTTAAIPGTVLVNRTAYINSSNSSFLFISNPRLNLSPRFLPKTVGCNFTCARPYNSCFLLFDSTKKSPWYLRTVETRCFANDGSDDADVSALFWGRKGLAVVAAAIGVVGILGCRRVVALEAGRSSGYEVWERGLLALRSSWPTILQVLTLVKEHGLILATLLGLSAFFSMAETSITTLWPWKVRELAEKESENGVFKMLRNDVTRFLTTILIGTTVVNIGATALVTEAATTIFGEAGVSAATGVMTVTILLLTEITPKSIAVHNATEVARFVVRPVAWLSLVLYPVGRIATFLSTGMLKLLGLKGRRCGFLVLSNVFYFM